MYIFGPTSTDLDLAVLAIAFFAITLVAGYIVLPIYDAFVGAQR